MKNIKVKINGGKGGIGESKTVQDLFFQMGYSWAAGKVCKYTDVMGYLYGDCLGNLSYSQVGESGKNLFYSSDKESWEELVLETEVKYSLAPGRATINVGGKVYYKDEYELALKNLTPVN